MATTTSQPINFFLSSESGLVRIELEPGGLGSRSGNRSLGEIRLWGVGCVVSFVSIFHTPQHKLETTTSQPVFFFSFFPTESGSTHPSESGSTISYVTSCFTFLENLPVLRANMESNDSLLEHTSVDCRFPLHLSLHGIQQQSSGAYLC